MSDSAAQASGSKKKTSFFRGLKKEFKKVSWPTTDELTKETTVVIIVSIILGVVTAGLDTIIQLGVQLLKTL